MTTELATEPKTTHVAGELLVPNFDDLPGIGIGDEHAYWMGVTHDCPISQINAVGLNFPKRNDIFVADPVRPGSGSQKLRVPAIGGLNKSVTVEHILALREILPRMVVRFFGATAGKHEERGTGKNTGDPHERPRKATLVIIPTAAQIVIAKKEGNRIPRYVRTPGDEPAAKFMFFKLCLDQGDPRRELTLPETIFEGGIFWPGDIDEINALLS